MKPWKVRIPTAVESEIRESVSWPRTDLEEIRDVRGELCLSVFEARPDGSARSLKFLGRLGFTVTGECGRCLGKVSRELETRFETLVDLEAGTLSAVDLETPPEPGGFVRTDETIDLTDEIRQRIVLATPAVLRCSETCRGLCPTCGANWNKVTCECGPSGASRPFAGLAGLLKKKEP